MKPCIRPYVRPSPCMFSPLGYWQVKLERSCTRVSRFNCHPSTVKSAGSTVAGRVARLLSADDNPPSAFLSAARMTGRPPGTWLIARSRYAATLARSQPARAGSAAPARWRLVSSRPAMAPGRLASRFGRQMVTAPTCMQGARSPHPPRERPPGGPAWPLTGGFTVRARGLRPAGRQFPGLVTK
jgi:hypothetical protein